MRKLPKRFLMLLDEIFKKYPDYLKEAYVFVYESLDFANRNLQRPQEQSLSGVELVQGGIVPLAHQKWSFLAENVLSFWNIKTGEDIGKIVERLVEFGIFRKDVNDSFNEFSCLCLKEMLGSSI